MSIQNDAAFVTRAIIILEIKCTKIGNLQVKVTS